MSDTKIDINPDSPDSSFCNIINLVPGGVCVYSWEDGALNPLVLSDCFLRLFGLSREDAMKNLSADPAFNVHPDDKEHVVRVVQDSFVDLSSTPSEIIARFQNLSTKQYHWLKVTANIVAQADGAKLAYVSYADITDEHTQALRLRTHDVVMNLAMRASNMIRVSFDITNRVITVDEEDGKRFGFIEPLRNIPESIFESSLILDGAADCYEQLCRIINGTAESVTYDVNCVNAENPTDNWLRVALVVVERDTSGRPAKAAGIARDITEYKALQKRIDSEQRITRSSMAAVMWTGCYNLSTRTIVSVEFSPLYHKLNSSSWFEYLDNAVVDDEQRIKLHEYYCDNALIEAYKRGTTSLEETYRMRDKSGRILWVKTTIELLHELNGDLLASAVTRDVNDEVIRKLAVDSLVHEEVDLLTCHELDTQTAHVIYSKYHKLPRITPVSSLIEYVQELKSRLVDTSSEELLEVLDFNNIMQSFETNPIFTYTFRVKSAAGEVRSKKIRMFILPDSSNLLVSMVRDVTDLVRREESKRVELSDALDAARVAEKARTDFFSRMSHDLRTPLNGILGSATLATQQPCSKEVEEYLEIIGHSGKFMLQLINDILDLSKIEDEKVVLCPSVLTKTKFMREIDMMFRDMCTNADIELCIEDNGTQSSIIADRKRLEQVFFNLLSNSVKFTPAGGRILVSMDDKPIDDTSIMARFVVSDTGCGMSPQFQKSMFEPFKQEQNTLSDSSTGTGLGLPIVKNLVELMHGSIECQSAPGKGTTFIVTIPFELAAEGVDEDTKTTSLDASALAGRSVLLAEDNKINSLIEERMLSGLGMKVTCVEDGLAALTTFGDSAPNTFDYVLMDMRMPRMDGLAAAKSIRVLNRPDAETVPIIALTANAFDNDVTAAVEAGMNQHLSKPVDFDKLAAALLEYVD